MKYCTGDAESPNKSTTMQTCRSVAILKRELRKRIREKLKLLQDDIVEVESRLFKRFSFWLMFVLDR